MGITREFQFIVGPETPELPTVGTPSGDSDILTLGYANAHYVQGKDPVADIAALKAITNTGANARVDNDLVYVDSKLALYRFDSASSTAGDDDLFVEPTAGSGRWIKLASGPSEILKITNATASTTSSTGALIVTGGLGVGGSVNIGTDLTVTGDLTVNGTTTTINTATLEVEDANVLVNNGGNQATANSNTAGLTVEMSDATHVRVGYDSSLTSRFKCGDVASESEIITAAGNQTMSGVKSHSNDIYMLNRKAVKFYETTSNGTNTVELRAPDNLANSLVLNLPDGDGAANQVLKTDGSGSLGWGTALVNPMTTRGDLIYTDSSSATNRLAVGGAYQTLRTDGTDVSWGRDNCYVGTNPEVGGSTPFQLTTAHSRTQIINPAGAITVNLPTTSILSGETWTIINRSAYLVTVQSSGANEVALIPKYGKGKYVALQATPTTAVHWLVTYRSPAYARCYLDTGSSQDIADSSETQLWFDVTAVDNYGKIVRNASPDLHYDAPFSGYYLVTGKLLLSSETYAAGVQRYIVIFVNGSVFHYDWGDRFDAAITGTRNIFWDAIVYASAGHSILVKGFVDVDGTAPTTTTGNPQGSYFVIRSLGDVEAQ